LRRWREEGNVDLPSSSDQTDDNSTAGLAGATSHGVEVGDGVLGAGHDDSSSADVPHRRGRTQPFATVDDNLDVSSNIKVSSKFIT